MNEELQATNEQFHVTNEELRRRSLELDNVNGFLKSILASLRGAVAVVDRDMRVQVWNGRAEDLWGLREHEVRGTHFMNLDIGLPVERLRHVLRHCLAGSATDEEVVLEAVNRRGRAIQCRVVCNPLKSPTGEIGGAIILMQD
jgi:two-component system CheB/CheR fusion protein